MTRDEIRAAEQWAGAKRVAQNMAEGMFEEFCKQWRIPAPKVFLPSPDRKTWEVHSCYPVGEGEFVVVIEPYDTFPSTEFIATLMMLGLKK
jgi:hypothetical protein